ncbi:hypothetical protein ACFQ2B_36525 [Streptomyces stramineus]|uniref:Secreted protein n=1 Tax=Streptomyces stramineus TaxID=173861 RepID=A0ABP3JAC4_9ACTN
MRRNIKRVATVVGAATAAVAMLGQGVAQAAPISRTTSCAKFSGDYTYWKNSDGWYGFSLSGSITRTCAGSAVHGIQVKGDEKGGDGFYYDYEGHSLSQGQSIKLAGFYASGGVKNIRIALD